MGNFKQWVRDNYDNTELEDIAYGGCSAGVSGLIYYHETCALYDKYEDDIWQTLWEMHENMGEENVLTMIAHFNGAENVGSDAQFKNLLVWAVVEEYAYHLLANAEDEGEINPDDEEEA